ncbi:hypothetical protein EAI71_15845 [Escherichia coli]|nr:hypothetical protein EAI71_15845 [Escherichia coli]
MTSLKTSIKTITYLSDIGCLEIQGASLAKSSRRLLSNKCVGDTFQYRRIFCQWATFGSPLFLFIFLFFA